MNILVSVSQWLYEARNRDKTLRLSEQSFRYLLCSFGNFTGYFSGMNEEIRIVCIYKFPIEPMFFGEVTPRLMRLLREQSLVIFERADKLPDWNSPKDSKYCQSCFHKRHDGYCEECIKDARYGGGLSPCHPAW